MQTRSRQIRCFDGFTLDLTRGCLLRGAREIKLAPKPFEALKYLVENPGRLISKAELIETIWPDTAVTDDSLVQCLMEVRRALGNDAQQFIKTVPRRGYIFDRPVTSGPTEAIDSVAVLPFVNVSGDLNAEYLSEGISDHVIDRLSKLPNLRKVIALSSVLRYKGKQADPQSVGCELGVRAVLMGRVNRQGDELSITTELVDVSDHKHLWGEQYHGKARDLQVLQQEISREIAEALRLRLTPGEQQQLARRDTTNPQAYELLLKGRFLRNKGGTENLKKAVEYYQQAIAVDPNYALAHAELSIRYSSLVAGNILDPKEYVPKAELESRKALDLDETLAEAHFAMAGIKLNAWDWTAAEREYTRAIELNPNLAIAHGGYACYLSLMGRHQQAVDEIKRARELDPLEPPLNAGVGFVLYLARRYDEATEALSKAIEFDPNYSFTHLTLGRTYAAKGMYAEAIAAYQDAIKLGLNTPSAQIHLGAAYAQAAEREKTQAILKQLQTNNGYVSASELAVLYGSLGERDQAFASLEQAYAAHNPQLQYLGVDPAFDSLRSDPRFANLLRRINLPG